MSEVAFKQPISLLLRQEWKHFGGNRRCAFRRGFVRQRLTAAPAVVQDLASRAEIPWTQHHEPAVGPTVPRERLARLRQEITSRPPSSYLTDTFSRAHNYLRISVTERCNLRCVYCMPEHGVPLSPPAHLLTTPEIVHLSRLFVSQGVNKIRLTGGEPTVRKDIVELMKQVGSLRQAGLRELCITTNGLSLHRKLDAMVEAGLTGVNLSLDTLDPYQFTIMTRRSGHDAVMRSIARILEMKKLGAAIRLKINCVVMRGINEREIIPFVELGRDKDIEVRFIEYMPFEGNKWSKGKMLGFKEMLAMIREKYPDVQKIQDHANDTSKTYQVPGYVGRMGFITSMTHNFCGTCNRLRITSDGNLKVCLFGNSEVSLRDILRTSNNGESMDRAATKRSHNLDADAPSAALGDATAGAHLDRDNRLLDVIGAAVKRKKAKHAGMGQLENMKNRPMILIDDFYSTSITPQFPFSITHRPLLATPYTRAGSHVHELLNRFSTGSSRQLRCYHDQVGQDSAAPQDATVKQSDSCPPLRPVPTASVYRRMLSEGSSSWIVPSETSPSDSGNTASFSRPQHGGVFGRPFAGCRHLEIKDSSRRSPHSNHFGQRRHRFNSDQVPGGDQVLSSRQRQCTAQTVKPESASQPRLTHLTSTGAAHMVDISQKVPTHRAAEATAFVLFSNPVPHILLKKGTLDKGDAIAVARIAGIQAAKKTADLIPLAHPSLAITAVRVDVELLTRSALNSDVVASESVIASPGFIFGGMKIRAHVSCAGKTGIEMEALTAANVAALTIYDMCKGVDKGMLITGVRVTMKQGGKSGSWALNGDIPDPPPSSPSPPPLATPIFQDVLDRRVDNIPTEPEEPSPAPPGDQLLLQRPPPRQPEDVDDHLSTIPATTPSFLATAAQELDLFIANTTSPYKAGQIARLRAKHKVITARIRDMQTRIDQGKAGKIGRELLLRNWRPDYDELQDLHRRRRHVAKKVLAWKMGEGSDVQEATEKEVDVHAMAEEEKAEAEAKRDWRARRWEGGVYGVWFDDRKEVGAEEEKAEGVREEGEEGEKQG